MHGSYYSGELVEWLYLSCAKRGRELANVQDAIDLFCQWISGIHREKNITISEVCYRGSKVRSMSDPDIERGQLCSNLGDESLFSETKK